MNDNKPLPPGVVLRPARSGMPAGAGMSVLATGHRGAWASVAQEAALIALGSGTAARRASKAAKLGAPWYRRYSQR